MKEMFRKILLVGTLNFGLVAFAEEEKTEDKSVSKESIQVVCPVNSDENCEDCNETESLSTENTDTK